MRRVACVHLIEDLFELLGLELEVVEEIGNLVGIQEMIEAHALIIPDLQVEFTLFIAVECKELPSEVVYIIIFEHGAQCSVAHHFVYVFVELCQLCHHLSFFLYTHAPPAGIYPSPTTKSTFASAFYSAEMNESWTLLQNGNGLNLAKRIFSSATRNWMDFTPLCTRLI